MRRTILHVALSLGLVVTGTTVHAADKGANGTLEERVARLEASRQEDLAAVDHQVEGLRIENLRLHLNFFSNISYELYNDSTRTDVGNRFALGQNDLLLSGQIGEALSFLNENVIEFGDGEPVLDLERAWVAYTVSDLLKIRAGRDHAPIGYWNQAFHHGALLQPSIDRPYFLNFEDGGGIIPNHVVGLFVSGRFDANTGSLSYDLGAGKSYKLLINTDGAGNVTGTELNPNLSSDRDQQQSYCVRLAFAPTAVEGLSLGLSTCWTRLGFASDDPTFVFAPFPQVISAADLTYFGEQLEVLGEFLHLNNRVTDGRGSSGNFAAYAHVGWRMDAWVPYVQVERTSLDVANDLEFIALGMPALRTDAIAGLRVDLHPTASTLKFELKHGWVDGSAEISSFTTNWAFGF